VSFSNFIITRVLSYSIPKTTSMTMSAPVIIPSAISIVMVCVSLLVLSAGQTLSGGIYYLAFLSACLIITAKIFLRLAIALSFDLLLALMFLRVSISPSTSAIA